LNTRKDDKVKVGLIINPVAGMGGSVGLKGTDGDAYKKAIEMGANPVTPGRTRELLSHLKNKGKIYFLVAPGKMGENVIKEFDLEFEVVGNIGEETTPEDTKKIARLMKEKGIDLLVFCGGDGTARDICDAIDLSIPVVALPSGVKMFSSVFAINPKAAAELIDKYINEHVDIQENEVLDINEDSFRKGRLDAKLHGYLKVPKIQSLVQAGKSGSKEGRSIAENKEEIAEYVIEKLEKDTLYLLGPGTTVKAITDHLKLEKTLLGIDALYNNQIIGTDLNEQGILDLLKQFNKAKIIITPIGGQGFIFGRGNKQLTPKILKMVGKENIIVISTEEKMRELDCLRVDTGDPEVDEMLKGYIRVIIGYKEELIASVDC